MKENVRRTEYEKSNIQQIISQVEKYDWVSFDIYDTLLYRNVTEPEDIFTIVSLRAQQQGIPNAKEFAKERVQGVRTAQSILNVNEVTLDEIYTHIQGFTKVSLLLLKELELQTEIEFTQVNLDMFAVYQWCVQNGKKIVVISDMYLPCDFLKDVLRDNGILCNNIFVSGDVKESKREGTIFHIVGKQLNISPKQIIHIGDAWKGDYLSPRKAGWNALHIPKRKRTIKMNTIPGKVMEALVYNNRYSDLYYEIGYSVLGPILFGFSQWLHETLEYSKIDTLLFLSRDGKIMREAYRLLYGDEVYNKYFYVSRRTLNTACLWMHSNFDKLKEYIVDTSTFSLGTFIDRIGLNIKDVQLELKNQGLVANKEYSSEEFWQSNSIREFYETIKSKVEQNSKKQYDYFVRYLRDNIEGDKLALIDIGWRGSMQKRMDIILKSKNIFKNCDITGFYVGIEENSDAYKGYLYSSKQQSCNKTIIDAGVGLFETLFLAREGTTLEYEMVENEVRPVLAQYEIEDMKMAACMKLIHKGAMKFVRKCKDLQLHMLGTVNKEEILQNYERLVFEPNKEELESLGKIVFDDTENTTLVVKRKGYEYLKNPKLLICDYHKAAWKIGFLKFNLSMRIPWGYIYRYLKDKRK